MLFGIILALVAMAMAVGMLLKWGREATVYVTMTGALSCLVLGLILGWVASVAAAAVLVALALFKWWRPIPTK